MRKHLTAALVVLFVVAMSGMTAAQLGTDDDQDSSDVNISVASEIAIDIHPQALDFTGQSVGQQTTSSDEGFTAIDLENTGSEYIDRIWANTTETTVQGAHYGVSANDEDDLNAGNMFQVKPNNQSGKLEGDSDNYNFVNRRDYATFNNSLKPSYINAPDDGTYEDKNGGTTQAQDVAVGRFRMGDQEYFYALPLSSTSDTCDGNGNMDTLLVGKEPHNATETAPIDFTSGSGYDYISGKDYWVYNLTTSSGNNYGVTTSGNDDGPNGVTLDDPTTGETRTYDVLTKCDTDGTSGISDTDAPHTIRTRYNPEAADSSDLSADGVITQYLLDAPSTPGDQLAPGEAVTFDTAIEVPRGIPEGIIDTGTFRLVVRADTSTT